VSANVGGWAMHGGGSSVRVVATGEIIMLNLTSPKEVVQKAWEGWQSGVFVKEFGRLTTRRGELGDHSDHSWCLQLVRDHSRKVLMVGLRPLLCS
jgi:hypothetical protein